MQKHFIRRLAQTNSSKIIPVIRYSQTKCVQKLINVALLGIISFLACAKLAFLLILVQ